MGDRQQVPAQGQRRSGSASIGFNPGLSGRGPTYERVQRLLEERRARAQARSSARSQLDDHEASGPGPQERQGRPFKLPDSDDSFEFDRPPHASEGGVSESQPEHASGARALDQQRSDISSVYAQGTRQQPSEHFGEEDEAEDDDYYDRLEQAAPEPMRRQTSMQYGQHYPADVDDEDDRYDARDTRRQPGTAPRPDDGSSDGATLAELEQMLNQTIQQFNIEEMRVPTSKDMAFGMAHGDGPFDISDIWAVDSQPSGSQVSASQRPGRSEGGASRDDGLEVNSYSGTSYAQQASLSPESSYASGHDAQPAHTTARDRPPAARPGSAQPRLLSGQTRPHTPPPRRSPRPQRHVQQLPQQQQRQAGLAARLGGRLHSAGGALEGSRRNPLLQQSQQSLLARHGAQHSQAHTSRLAKARGPEAEPAILRRDGTPTRGRVPAPQNKSMQPHMSPRFNRPPRLSPGRFEDANEGFSFKPQINPRSREIAERLLPVDRERRLEQLSRPRNDRLEQRYQQLRQAKEEEELRDCTFQPQTGRPPSAPRLGVDQPVHERLYNIKPAWQHKREEILREREQSVLANCTFQPQCGSRQTLDDVRRSNSAPRRRPASAAAAVGGATPYVPIHQRVADLLRSRNEKLAKAQIRTELGGGSVTFQPEINRRSVLLAAERQRQQPVEVATLPASERLYRLAQEQQAAAIRRREAGGDELGSGMRDVSASRDQRQSFLSPRQQQPWGVPAINPRSRALAESSDLPQDFLARQAYLAALGHEKRALYRSLLEESTCTFQPQLLSRGGSVGSSCGFGSTPRGGPRWSVSGGDGDRLSKLAYEDVQRSAARREALEQHHYGQYTFTPAINERSRRIGRRHSLTDLYRDDERQAKIERLAAAAEAQRAAECTFRPNINPRSASLGRQRRGSLVLASTECHERANKLRSSILMEARALREYEDMKECTFTPAINRVVPKPAGPIAVPGLGRHMELRDLARRKREADEARKAEVWNQRPKSPGPPAGVTVPRPFSFEARVLPWQVNRPHQQQQQYEQQQQRALAVLKNQRRQQRKDAEERRSAHLQKIMQEAQAAQPPPQQQHGAAPVAAQQMQQTSSGTNGASSNGNGNGRRRIVSFQSPSSGDIYGPGSPQGVAEMPADSDGQDGRVYGGVPAAARHLLYGGDDVIAIREEFQFAGGGGSIGVEEELSVRFP